MSADDSKAVHCIGDESYFMPGGYDLAALAAGGAITAMENVLDGSVRNAYALCRYDWLGTSYAKCSCHIMAKSGTCVLAVKVERSRV
jgi:hypothetical protein